MPFTICRHRQRGVDQRDDRLRKVRSTAIADPLRVAPVDHETGRLEGRHVARHAGLAGTEIPHQFANTMFPPIPHHSEGFETNWLCDGRKNRVGIHGLTNYAPMRISLLAAKE